MRDRRRYSSIRHNHPPEIIRARELRKNATYAERILWSALRGKQLRRLKFRRQCPLGEYFADFVCLSERLIVELDGVQHEQPEHVRYDQRLTMWLRGKNFRVLRFRNDDVRDDLPTVLATIVHAIDHPDKLSDFDGG
jgi:5-methyltetrahydrofolate--homocysteine methyltransferase